MFYKLKEIDTPWGDYGSILLTGMTGHTDRVNGRLQYERTGPFQPSINLSSWEDLVVVESAKHLLKESCSAEVTFQPVDLSHIVYLDWLTWDQNADEPAQYPSHGDPEGYILDETHSDLLVSQMESVWEVEIIRHGIISDAGIYHSDGQLRNIVRPLATYDVLVSEKVKIIFESMPFCGVKFEAIKSQRF